MNYQITCPCGHTFQRSEEELKGTVPCPACARPLSVVIEPVTAPASVAAAPADPEPTKRCPFCGEVILAIARKCKHCGEFLDRAEPGNSPLSTGAATSQTTSTTPATPADEPVFSLTVSQWDNFWRYLILLTIVLVVAAVTLSFSMLRVYAAIAIPAAMVLAGFIAWFFYLHAKNTRIYIRPNRIDVEKGILSRSLDSLELFRINDTELNQGFAERIVGIGTIKLMTTDSSEEPVMTLYQIPRAREVLKYLQTQIPIAARQRGAVYMEK